MNNIKKTEPSTTTFNKEVIHMGSSTSSGGGKLVQDLGSSSGNRNVGILVPIWVGSLWALGTGPLP